MGQELRQSARPGSKVKDSETFLFRCEWVDSKGNPEGFTYALTRPVLLKEVHRRQYASKDRAKEVLNKPVRASMEFYKLVQASKGKFYSTLTDKHEGDLT